MNKHHLLQLQAMLWKKRSSILNSRCLSIGNTTDKAIVSSSRTNEWMIGLEEVPIHNSSSLCIIIHKSSSRGPDSHIQSTKIELGEKLVHPGITLHSSMTQNRSNINNAPTNKEITIVVNSRICDQEINSSNDMLLTHKHDERAIAIFWGNQPTFVKRLICPMTTFP